MIGHLRDAHPRIRLPEKNLYFPLIAGCLLRLLLWTISGEITTVADENNYLRLGQLLDEGRPYHGQWPPGYPSVIATALRLFGESGPDYLRFFQIISSFVAGLFVIQMSHFLYGTRGALISGYAWAFYLPLAFYVHRFWPETLFLNLFVPCLYLLLMSSQRTLSNIRLSFILGIAGTLFALSLYLKESGTYLFIPLSIWLFFSVRPRRLMLIFPLSIAIILLPLVLRNYRAFRGFVPVASTLVTNIRAGINARYVNHDYNRVPKLIPRAHQKKDGSWDFVYRHFIDYGEGWPQSSYRRYLEATKADIRSASDYALDHKKAFVCTRIKKLADFVTPLSFLVRDLSPEFYPGIITSRFLRRILITVSLASVPILFGLAWVGFICLRHTTAHFSFFLIVFFYFASTAMLISFSRIRIPIEPLLLVLLGSCGVTPAKDRDSRFVRIAILAGLLALLCLWALNFKEIILVVANSW